MTCAIYLKYLRFFYQSYMQYKCCNTFYSHEEQEKIDCTYIIQLKFENKTKNIIT